MSEETNYEPIEKVSIIVTNPDGTIAAQSNGYTIFR